MGENLLSPKFKYYIKLFLYGSDGGDFCSNTVACFSFRKTLYLD